MAKYGNQYVDEKYLPTIEPNLYTDDILIPDVTFTADVVEGPAGGYFVHKLDGGDAVEPGTPGRDFNDESAKDDLIQVSYNNNFQKSRKIYGVQAAAVAFNAGEEYLANSLEMTREGRRYSALACMVNEGTKSPDTTAITKSNIVEYFTNLRKEIKKNHGTANFALVSPEVYATALQVLGLQSYADEAVKTAELIKRFGLAIIECNAFDKENAKYYDFAGNLHTIDLSHVDMIVGNAKSFKLDDNFTMYRLIDSENFAGSKAQVEFNTALRVTNPKQIIVKSNGELSA